MDGNIRCKSIALMVMSGLLLPSPPCRICGFESAEVRWSEGLFDPQRIRMLKSDRIGVKAEKGK